MGAQIKVRGKTLDVEKDFTWRELATVEELADMPLGKDGSLDYAMVGAAFIFVVMKRDDPTLTWDAFLDSSTGDVKDADDEPDEPAAKKPRPTKPSA